MEELWLGHSCCFIDLVMMTPVRGRRVVKGKSPGRKKCKQIGGPETSPAYAEEVDDLELSKAPGDY